MIIIIEVFIKSQSWSIKTLLSAYMLTQTHALGHTHTHTHTHTCTHTHIHTHTHTHTHRGTLTQEHTDYTKRNLHINL